ncbi:MAG: hypothetical protein A2719_01895 [Candidatus Ryanbacteria bacterium RIFCSPHIGHO2_01_FULL_45_22]|uniref:CPBP family intramembrane metalloprotease n=2 Tax=Candidatus Ryaniibacteriota TaxID=1817914 RepID=A0A1G2FZD0_9BACT|nr:MAG: hypothetical protein A2719_01895 [Candidatus Ryanbacteria bacterium RIFCSPHIGHO2_01_FULL_45_22]OGZ45373.1 MAG: hypothetical protein A3J54_03990 [Candidatus Ryanbacteria bacterium RIFCSPHIGHO2_02_FULL_45_13b]
MVIFLEKTKIFMWLGLWLVIWGVALRLWHGEPLLTEMPGMILIVFLVGITNAFSLFSKERKMWLSKMDLAQTAIMAAGALVLSIWHPISLANGMLVAGHVFFQQIMIAFLIFMAQSTFKQTLWRVLLFYGASHLLLVFFMPVVWGLAFTLFSLFGTILFVSLIERAKYGIGLSYLLHLAFYFFLVRLPI